MENVSSQFDASSLVLTDNRRNVCGIRKQKRASCVSITDLTEGTTAADSWTEFFDEAHDEIVDDQPGNMTLSQPMSPVLEHGDSITNGEYALFPSGNADEFCYEYPNVSRPLPHHRCVPLRTQDVLVGTDLSPSVRQFSNLTDPEIITTICRQLVPGWTELPPEGVIVSKILAGLTNQLFSVSVKELYATALDAQHVLSDPPNPGPTARVLFRIYGKDVEELYDPELELEVFKTLANKGIAARLLGEFGGGRIEEWIDGLALRVQDARKDRMLVAVAKIIGKFHNLYSDGCIPHHWSKEPSCGTQLARWTGYVTRIMKTYAVDNPVRKVLVSLGVEQLLQEANALGEKLLPPTLPPNAATNVVFAHNDIQENNIMCVGGALKLIDFEYAAFNYAGYDVANFFVECTIDYTHADYPYYYIEEAAYPSRASRRLFAAAYLSEMLDRPVSPKDVQLLTPFLDGVERMTLASHLMWGFWSIIRAVQAPTFENFDYLEYAADRFKLYWKQLNYLKSRGAFGDAASIMWQGLDEDSFVSDEDFD